MSTFRAPTWGIWKRRYELYTRRNIIRGVSGNECLLTGDDGAICGDIGSCARAGAIQEDALLCAAICSRDTDWAQSANFRSVTSLGVAKRDFALRDLPDGPESPVVRDGRVGGPYDIPIWMAVF